MQETSVQPYIRNITVREIRHRIAEFALLTSGPGSDLTMLLEDIAKGEDPIIAARVWEEAGKIHGWCVCERFQTRNGRKHVVLNVYVEVGKRGQGRGTALVREVLATLSPIMERPHITKVGEFWEQFGDLVVP